MLWHDHVGRIQRDARTSPPFSGDVIAPPATFVYWPPLRSTGFPRISPMEPHIFENRLLLPGMPGTTKFRDLARDPRFCLHTATVDTQGDRWRREAVGLATSPPTPRCFAVSPKPCSTRPDWMCVAAIRALRSRHHRSIGG
ncbi:hypothetical protein BZL30_9346 [Mycobacterium kansasii]|uniref:Pyridoxamine 5'-phosphate oxidase family protein n=1 Tax=Mycobacterium kansasii TaxID=1768 RepID=A0A1V3WCC6_MYCKA|nr:hypothetical protein BZL30_9346 [Mycobacterium kansasii]